MKRIAVLVRDRQGEALRMSCGLLLLDDVVEVFILDRELELTEENSLYLETLKEMDVKLYTNYKPAEGMEYLTTEEIAKRLPNYDHIVPY